MKFKSNELNKIIKNGHVDEDSYEENFAPAAIQKMQTPDISEKRKQIATYRGIDPKRKVKKPF